MRKILAIGAVVVAGCGAAAPRAPTNRRRPQSPHIFAALAPLPDGGLRAGDLQTGRIADVLGPGGVPSPAPPLVAAVDVKVGGQRGLVGLAVDRRDRTFAAYTRAGDGRLVVAQVAPGAARIVWRGPPSTTLADGGHLAFAADGRLLIGIGDLQNPPATANAATANGKLLALDPDGPPDQQPRVLSHGWNNPYAFAVTEGGDVLVADNAPGRQPERIAQGLAAGGSPRAVTDIPEHIAPSGLAVTGADEIAVCGVRSGRLDRFRHGRNGRWRLVAAIAPCRYGVARLTDGRLAVSGDQGVKVVRP